MADPVKEPDEDDGKKRLAITSKFLQAACFFIAAAARSRDLEVLMIVTDKHERPAVCMASGLSEDKQADLLLDTLLQMEKGPVALSKLARRMVELYGDDQDDDPPIQ